MAITNTWVIEKLECYPVKDGLTDVVSTIHWRLNAFDGSYTASAYGEVQLTLDPDAPYVPFSELTEAQVIGWMHDALGPDQVSAHEAGAAHDIEVQINPPITTPPLPWAV